MEITKCITYSLYSLIMGTAVITGCANDSPEQRFDACFNAIKANDYTDAHRYFVYLDRVTIGAPEFASICSLTRDENQYVDQIYSHIQYDFGYVQQKAEDTIHAKLTIKAPAFMEKIMPLLFFSLDTIIVTGTVLDSNSIPLEVYSGLLVMVKEERNWYIHGNWEEQRRIESEQVNKRLDYLEKFLSIGSIRAYQTKNGQTRLSAVLHNNGDRSLSDVEVYIVGYHKKNPCFTATVHPLREEILLPGKTYRFSADISQAPANWSGKVEVRILNCLFTTQSEQEQNGKHN